jgi:hypothetical protein
MNRRQLLATVAAIPMSGMLPPQVFADALNVPSIPTSEPSPLKLCVATARRIEEIIERNRIRAEACLPLLSIPKELRRMKEAADAAALEAFADVNRGTVWDEVLATMRKARGEPNWHPSSWIEGMAFQSEVSRILRQRFNASQNWQPDGENKLIFHFDAENYNQVCNCCGDTFDNLISFMRLRRRQNGGPPKSRIRRWALGLPPLCATTRPEQVQQDAPEKALPIYSMTSSARASTVAGTSRPSALAV